MHLDAKIYIAGHRGLVGSALLRKLQEAGYHNFVLRTSSQLDLTRQQEVEAFFEAEKPEYVFLAAAKVGGIVANNLYRADFIYQNLQIQNNIIHQSYVHGVRKLLFLGSSCIYPKFAPQPMRETDLLTDQLEYTNEPYAIAKIAGIKTCESYNLQYGTNFIAVMPTNLYGVGDNFDLEKSHVLPALIRKMHLAKLLAEGKFEHIRRDIGSNPIEGRNEQIAIDELVRLLAKYGIHSDPMGTRVELWGSGTPRREFLHADDLADACVFIMQNIDFSDIVQQMFGPEPKEVRNTHINIGVGHDISIQDLALLVAKIVGYQGAILWDTTKPDGTPRKLMQVDKLGELGWRAGIELEDGIRRVYEHYIGLNKYLIAQSN